MRYITALLVVSAMLGCTTTDMRPYTPVEKKTKHSADQLIAAAREVLQNEDYVVISSEEEIHSFTTREKEYFVSSVPRLAYKYAWQVDTRGGTLRLSATCKKNSALERKDYQSCGEQRPRRVIDEQKALEKAILAKAKERE